jgi:hypothetical protein
LDVIVKGDARGTITISSLSGTSSFNLVDGRISATGARVKGYLPGTVFDIKIPIANIPILPFEEERFEW